MKRVVSKKRDITIEDMFGSLINTVMSCGYDIVITGDSVPEIRIASKSDIYKMPTFDVSVDVDDDGECKFDVKVSFPELDTSKLDSSDEVEYWTQRWSRASKIATELVRTKYNIHDLENYKNEE